MRSLILNRSICLIRASFRTVRSYSFLLLLGGVYGCFGGCTNPGNELKKQIRTALQGDATIREDEWKNLAGYVEANAEELKEVTVRGKADCGKLKALISQIVKGKAVIQSPCERVAVLRPAVKVFLENSQSMDGYVKGQTDFEAALFRLLVDLGNIYHPDSIHVNFINSTNVHPMVLPRGNLTSSIRQFIGSLEPGTNPWEANGGPSELNQVLNLMLASSNPNDLSVLISDFIYSQGPDTRPGDGLEFARSATYSSFLDYSDKKATLVWQLKSKFQGNYWAMDTKITTYAGVRPYYIWFVGKPDIIRQVMKNTQVGEYKGYQNRLVFFPVLAGDEKTTGAAATLLSSKDKIGSFRLTTSDRTRMTMEEAEPDNGVFQFMLAVNLSEVPATESYCIDKNNYTVSPGFTLVNITRVSEKLRGSFSDQGAENNDWKRMIELQATHLLTLRAVGDFPRQPITIQLKDQLPGWVAASHSDDDRAGPDTNHTFGLNYLIKGVSQAYRRTGKDPVMAQFTVQLH